MIRGHVFEAQSTAQGWQGARLLDIVESKRCAGGKVVQRQGKVTAMRWCDLAEGVWSIPQEKAPASD